jgi:hypothetical protein
MWCIISDERTGLPFTVAAEIVTVFDCLRFENPPMEGQAPLFISPRNKVVQLYSQTLGSLFVASYDSQGYDGGIQSQSYFYDGRFTASQFALAPSTLRIRNRVSF